MSVLRDAGGLRLASGAQIREGLALRVSGGLVDGAELAELDAAGLTAIVDLRNHLEDREVLEGWAAAHGVRYAHEPMSVLSMQEIGERLSRLSTFDEARAMQVELYLDMAERHGPEVARTMDVLAGEGPVGFGCAAGKDRTGIATAALHVLLGATPDEAAAHYVALAPPVEALVPLARRHFDLPDPLPPAVEAFLGVEAATMTKVLDAVCLRHGTVERWLLDGGLDPATPDRLRAKLLA